MYWCDTNKIFEATLAKMRNKLAESGYVGYIDINCIANINGIYPLEFTSRFGYPTISIQMEGVLSNWGEFLYALAKKEKFDFRVKRGFQIGVVLAVPPFPFRDPAAFRRYSEDATLIFKRPNYDGVHLCDVKLVEGDWRLAGNSGYALIVTGSGSTMDEARQLAYRRIKNISIPNMFYRTDIGVRWHSDSDRLQTWGYLY
jgi:phosphoribosylamine--glycine ligase